jgi:hypothetical protein
MIGEWINHLWQSTMFAMVAALLTLAFRRNRAQVRYWLWLSASFKAVNNCDGSTAAGVGPFYVPIVPMSVNVPVALSMLYIETLFEPEFVT